MLRSWRANCDVQILIYDSDPNSVDPMEVSRVTDYIVGYIGKGNSMLIEERETNKQLAMKAQEVTGDKEDLKALTKAIMNKASSRRLIPKQEASLLLAQLKLTHCTKMFSTVSLSHNLRITTNGSKPSNSFLSKYEHRIGNPNMSLHQFFHHDRAKRKLPPAMPHCTGIAGKPTFPITEAYAKQTLLMCKPWTMFPKPVSWVNEFKRFISSKECPMSAKMAYNRVMQRHYNGTKFVDPVSTRPNHDPNYESEEDEMALALAGTNGTGMPDDDLFGGLIKGESYSWGTAPVVSFFLSSAIYL